MSLLTSKKRNKRRDDDLVDQSVQVALLPEDFDDVFVMDASEDDFDPIDASSVLQEATAALPGALSAALEDGSSQLVDAASGFPDVVGDVLRETSSDLAQAASALPDSVEAGAGSGAPSELAAAAAALPEALEGVLDDIASELPDGQPVALPADQIGRIAAARAAAGAATARTARSARTAAANQARQQAHATAEAGRRAGRQAAATARMQGQVAAEAAQRQLDSARESARESAQHLREATANAPVVQKVSPKARRRAAELEQARLRAASRRRVALLVLLGAGVVGAVALYLKRRSAQAAAVEENVDSADVLVIEETVTVDAPDLLVVEDTVITAVDFDGDSSEGPGVVRTEGNGPEGPKGPAGTRDTAS